MVKSSASTCTSTQFSAFYAVVSGTSVQLQIFTNNPVQQQYFCLSCDSNDASYTGITSQPFQMQVKGCASYVSVANIVGSPFSYAAPTTETSSTHQTQVLPGATYFSTTDSTNCAMTFALYEQSTSSLFAEAAWIAFGSDGTLSVNENRVQSKTLRIRVTAGTNNAFDVYTNYFTVTTYCSTGYTITLGTATSPQYVTHGSSSVGFTLPTFTRSNSGCALTLSTSTTTGSYTAHSQLGSPATVGSTYVVKPTNTALHLKYTFYTRLVIGDDTHYYGPYVLDVGCTTTAVTTTQGASFSATATTKNIGDSGSLFYYFYPPTTDRSYCTPIQNQAVENDGSTDSTKVWEYSTEWMNLISSTATAETFTFKVKTTFTGSLVTLVSPTISMTLQCGATYYVRNNGNPTNYQYISHTDANAGFLLVSYYTELASGLDTPGCPVTTIEVKSCNGCTGTVAGLDSTTTTYNGNEYAQPSGLNQHGYYYFYAKARSATSFTYYGQYRLAVGCFASIVSYANSGSLGTYVLKYVGDSVSNVYTFANPARQQSAYAWCAPEENTIVTTGNGAWSGTTRLIGSGSQPYTSWDLNSLSGAPEDIYFRMRTTFPGTVYHYTGTNLRIAIECGLTYTISEGTYYNSLSSTQYSAHGSSTTTGFYLPPYTSSQQTGCPAVAPTLWRSWTSCAYGGYFTNLQLPNSNSGYYIVRPAAPSSHTSYLNFYIKVRKHSYSGAASNHQCMGPYQLYVGCFAATVTLADSSDLVTSRTRFVGDNTAYAYTYTTPTSTRTYCTAESHTFQQVSGSLSLSGSGSQPYSSWTLSSTSAVGAFTFYIRSTFTNSMTHNSPTISMSVACGNAYSITISSAPTNPQYIAASTATGFVLPTYTTLSYEAQCPVNLWEISSSGSQVTAPSGLANPSLSGGVRSVKASDQSVHARYTFYTKISASGGSAFYYGPYYLDVGCQSSALTATVGTAFATTTTTTDVGAAGTGIYTFDPPTANRAYCQIISNTAVNSDGSTTSTKITCGSQPCTSFNFASTTGAPETVVFKIKTLWTGSVYTMVQGPMSVVLRCATYTLSEVSAPTNPQYKTHGSSAVGFILPSYKSTQNTGCPPNQFQLSTVNSGVTTPSTLNGIATISSAEVVVPSNNGLHQAYTFYVKVTETLGGSNTFFGSYTVNIGCFTGAVTFSDNGSLVTSVAKWVGDSLTSVYTFALPTSTRSWCTQLSTEILTSAGATWSGSAGPAKLTGTGSEPQTSFNLVSTTNPETVSFKIGTTFTNNLVHKSATVNIVISCNSVYAITATAATTTQFLTHGSSTTGFVLPTFTSSQQTGCPVNLWETATLGSGSVSVPTGLPANPTGAVGSKVVIPSNTGLHQAYTFYVKTTALGGSTSFFGPYVMNIGCFAGSVTFTDATNFVSAVSLLVGDSTSNVYTLNVPTSTRAWCTIATNVIVNTDGGTHSPARINQCSGAACNVYSLIGTTIEEVINFKVLTTWTNGQTHLSAAAAITITCGSAYTVTEVASPTNPQYVTHGSSSVGFILPTYQSSQNVGCPIDFWKVTNAISGAVSIPTGLNEQTLVSTDRYVKPTNNALHLKYTFFTKIIARGGSVAYFGPYYVDVGCTTTSVVFTDNASFVTNVPLFVGDSPTNVYTLQVPSATRAWCQIVRHDIVNTDGSTYSGPVRFASPFGCSSQPCTIYSLAATTYHETINFAVKTTFTNLFHVSAATKFTITCASTYLVSATSHTTPQYVPHDFTTEGFYLPTYTSAQNTGCPIDTWQITSASSGTVAGVSGMASNAVLDSGTMEARPTNGNLHTKYLFYIKASASDGGSAGYFGQYVLHVGCTSETVSFADISSLQTIYNLWVGLSLANRYLFYQPTSTRAWCLNVNNEIVNDDATGTAWTGTAKLTPMLPQPATNHYIYQTETTEIFKFKIKSTMTNSMTHLSQTITYTIFCANHYTISEQAGTVTNPQFIAHNDYREGFTLPTYLTEQQVGCPPTAWQVTTSLTTVSAHSELKEAAFESGERKVKPINDALQKGYKFYLKVTANRVYLEEGDSIHYFGLYDLRVGCYPDSLTWVDSASFVVNVNLFVGGSTRNAYTMYNPTPSRAWCRCLTNEFATDQAQPWIAAAKFGTDAGNFQPYSSFNLVSTSIPEVVSFRIKSTYTNTQIHYSPVGRVSITCGNYYTFEAITTVVNPQFVSQDDGYNTGFTIPKFKSSQELGCPVSSYETTLSNTYMSPPTDLNNPVYYSSQWIVQPSDTSHHQLYVFYVKVNSVGGSVGYFGGYTMVVGCTQASLTITDNSTFINNVPMMVGDDATAVYVYNTPISSRDYCQPQRQEIVDEFGRNWTQYGKPHKLKPTALPNCTVHYLQDRDTSQQYTHNCTIFDLVSSTMPDFIQFKIKTTYPNNMVHYSPLASISIAEIFAFTESTRVKELKSNVITPIIPDARRPHLQTNLTSFNQKLVRDAQRKIREEEMAHKVTNHYGGKVLGGVIVGGVLAAGAVAVFMFFGNSQATIQNFDQKMVKRLRADTTQTKIQKEFDVVELTQNQQQSFVADNTIDAALGKQMDEPIGLFDVEGQMQIDPQAEFLRINNEEIEVEISLSTERQPQSLQDEDNDQAEEVNEELQNIEMQIEQKREIELQRMNESILAALKQNLNSTMNNMAEDIQIQEED